MKNEKRTFRSISIIVLLLAILLLTGFSWYAVNKQNNENQLSGKKELQVNMVSPKPPVETPKPVTDSSVALKTDSVSAVQTANVGDSVHSSIVKVKHHKLIIEKKEMNNEIIEYDKPVSEIPAREKYAKWRFIIKKDMICVYPGDKWQNVFVVYPDTKTGKENRHILKPDFPGVVYLAAEIGNIDLNNVNNNVLIEKYTASETDQSMYFFISLKSNPAFIIFGDYEDPQNQYIFQNNRLSGYESIPGSEKMFSLNSK